MAVYTTETIIEITHWSDKLFSFKTTRAPGLRFENGQFVMIGFPGGERPVARAYSIASANYEDHLEFYSIKVPHGALTSRLQHVKPGDRILVSSKPTGTLVVRDLRPGRRLFLLATGTGIAPFLSVVKDPATYEAFERIIVVRGVRFSSDLAYADSVLANLHDDPYLGEIVRDMLLDYPCVSRNVCPGPARVTTALHSGQLCRDLRIEPVDPKTDRFMICGNVSMLADSRMILDEAGFTESPQIGVCGDYVYERAFTEVPSRKAAA